MKLSLSLITAFVPMAMVLTGCEDEFDPVAFTLNLSFTTENGVDLFESDTSYISDSVSFFWIANNSDPTVNGLFPHIDCRSDGVLHFSMTEFGSEYYVLFGNGDQDTLLIDNPRALGKFSENLHDVEGKIDFYYNGELIETWDFDREPELGFGMRPICGWSELDMIDRPLVLTIVKKPQPEEFGN